MRRYEFNLSIKHLFSNEEHFIKEYQLSVEAFYGFKMNKQDFVNAMKQLYFHEIRILEQRAEEKGFDISKQIKQLRDIDFLSSSKKLDFVIKVPKKISEEDSFYIFDSFWKDDTSAFDIFYIEGHLLEKEFYVNLFSNIAIEELTNKELTKLPEIYSSLLLKYLIDKNNYGFFLFFALNNFKKEDGFLIDPTTIISNELNIRQNDTIRKFQRYSSSLYLLSEEMKNEILNNFKHVIELKFGDAHLKEVLLSSLEDFSNLQSFSQLKD